MLSSSLDLLCTNKPGDYFGEIALFYPNTRRTAWVRAKTFCVLAELSKQKFDETLCCFPEQRQKMLERIKGFSIKDIEIESNFNSKTPEEKNSRNNSITVENNNLNSRSFPRGSNFQQNPNSSTCLRAANFASSFRVDKGTSRQSQSAARSSFHQNKNESDRNNNGSQSMPMQNLFGRNSGRNTLTPVVVFLF